MYHTLDEFIADFNEDTAEIEKNIAALTDASLSVRPAAGFASLGEVAIHLINAWEYVLAQAGKPWAFEQLPESASAAQIAAGMARLRAQLPAGIRSGWTDAELAEPVEMWGMAWTRAKVLWEMHKHTLHHHGQLTTLMRLAGLPVHGLFGPSQEEAEAHAGSAPS